MKKLLIGGASIAALAVGSVAVATLSPIQLAGAHNQPAIEMQAGQAPSTTQPGQPGKPAHPGKRGGRGGGGIEQTLDELVKDGTITQEQADKIKAKLKSKMGAGRRGPGDFMAAGIAEVAKSIGITEDQLKTELKSGKSIAEVAQAHGVDPQKVINDLVAAATKKLDEAVASGKLPADRAAKLKEQLTDHITKMVNAKRGEHPGDGKGRGPKPDQPSSSTPAPGNESPTTAPPSSASPTTAAPTTTAPQSTGSPTTEAPRSPSASSNGNSGGSTGTTR